MGYHILPDDVYVVIVRSTWDQDEKIVSINVSEENAIRARDEYIKEYNKDKKDKWRKIGKGRFVIQKMELNY